MFGNNKQVPIVHDRSDALAVQEIFYTLQGEGPFSGKPAVFVRLAGCNLRCHFCDTEFDTGLSNVLSIPHIIKAIDFETQFNARKREFVVITGGEPMRQDITRLCSDLLASGTTHIQIETAGTVWVEGLRSLLEIGDVSLVCSPKTPRISAEIVRYCRHYKYVITADELAADGLPEFSTQEKDKPQMLWRPWDVTDRMLHYDTTIWVSPCDAHDDDLNKANVIAARESALRHGYRLSLQTHKIVGVA